MINQIAISFLFATALGPASAGMLRGNIARRELHHGGGAAEYCENICEEIHNHYDVDFTAGLNGQGSGQCIQGCANCLNPGQGNGPNCVCQEWEALGLLAEEGLNNGQCVSGVNRYCDDHPDADICDRKHDRKLDHHDTGNNGAAGFCELMCEEASNYVNVDFTAGLNGQGSGQCIQGCANCLNPGQGNGPNCVCQVWAAAGLLAGLNNGQCVSGLKAYCDDHPNNDLCNQKGDRKLEHHDTGNNGAAGYCEHICEHLEEDFGADFSAGLNGQGSGQCLQGCANCLNPGQGNGPNCACQEFEAGGILAEHDISQGQCVSSLTHYCQDGGDAEFCNTIIFRFNILHENRVQVPLEHLTKIIEPMVRHRDSEPK